VRREREELPTSVPRAAAAVARERRWETRRGDYVRAIGLGPRGKPYEGRDRRMHVNGPRPRKVMLGPIGANSFCTQVKKYE
jgi:hypothetical protein